MNSTKNSTDHDPAPTADVVIIGGGLNGSVVATVLARRGLSTVVLESRGEEQEQKIIVGEALTEGTSVFFRHELGLTDWLKENAFRKFGFDFLVVPEGEAGARAERFEDCHEMMLSLVPLERTAAGSKLIPTFHVERPPLNRKVRSLALAAGAEYRYNAPVEHVALADAPGGLHEVRYGRGGETRAGSVKCRFVVDCSGRRAVLGRQLGIHHPAAELDTAAIWNRFEGISDDPAIWSSFHGIDRRRQTIHCSGAGFWIWWIHQNDNSTSVGITYDRAQHQPDVKSEDLGFAEMIAKFPPVARLLATARAKEPYQYLAHLPYRSDHWIDPRGYALVGDAAWFVDALYSIGLETACRQTVNLTDVVLATVKGAPPAQSVYDGLNDEFRNCCDAVIGMNRFKYTHAWHDPRIVWSTAVYELGEISELYHLQRKSDWRPEVLGKHYRLQWNSALRKQKLDAFQRGALEGKKRPLTSLMKKGLIPGKLVYRVNWLMWNVQALLPLFFMIVRLWGYSERLAQRTRLWPDVLRWMAGPMPPRRALRATPAMPALGAASVAGTVATGTHASPPASIQSSH